MKGEKEEGSSNRGRKEKQGQNNFLKNLSS